MSQTSQMTLALKRCLRSRGLIYRDLAQALSLSESSVKRLFSEQTFTLQRLEEICQFLGLSLSDLVRLASDREESRQRELSEAQEQALVEDRRLLSFFYLLLIGWNPDRIARRLGLSDRLRQRCLGRLSQLKLVELVPGSHVRLLVDPQIRWRRDGPIRKRFEERVKLEFLAHPFEEADEWFDVQNGELSFASIRVLTRKLKKLSDEFSELVELDRNLPSEKKRGFGLLIGARPWTFWSLVENLRDR